MADGLQKQNCSSHCSLLSHCWNLAHARLFVFSFDFPIPSLFLRYWFFVPFYFGPLRTSRIRSHSFSLSTSFFNLLATHLRLENP